MNPEHSGQQGGGEASFVPAGSSSGIRGGGGGGGTGSSNISSGFRNTSSGDNKPTASGSSHGNRGGLEIKVVHTNIRTGT